MFRLSAQLILPTKKQNQPHSQLKKDIKTTKIYRN